jgi:hypothetical protein
VAEKGLRLELGAYKCNVFVDWRDQRDDGTRPWGALCDLLAGRGVPSLDDELRALELKPVHDALRATVEPPVIEVFAPSRTGRAPARFIEPPAAVVRLRSLIREVNKFASSPDAEAIGIMAAARWRGDLDKAVAHFEQRLAAAHRLDALGEYMSTPWRGEAGAVLPVGKATATRPAVWATVLAWCALEALGDVQDPANCEVAATDSFDALRWRGPLAHQLAALGMEGEERWRAAARIRASFAHVAWLTAAPSPASTGAPLSWLHDPELAWLIGLHEYEGVRYFNKELFERLLWWMALRPLLTIAAEEKPDAAAVRNLERQVTARMRAAAEAGYRVESLLEEGIARRDL